MIDAYLFVLISLKDGTIQGEAVMIAIGTQKVSLDLKLSTIIDNQFLRHLKELFVSFNTDENCKLYGNSFEKDAKTANQACCACGGGEMTNCDDKEPDGNSSMCKNTWLHKYLLVRAQLKHSLLINFTSIS